MVKLSARTAVPGLLVAIVLAWCMVSPVQSLRELQAWGQAFTDQFEQNLLSYGWKGPLYLFLIYLVTTVFMLPLCVPLPETPPR